MIDNTTYRPDLPAGWHYPDTAESERLHAELQRELPPGHLLFDVPVTTFAASDGTDDTLFRHHNESERFTVIHLTWLGKTEINSEHPTVEFDGTFTEFLANQERRYGLKPPSL